MQRLAEVRELVLSNCRIVVPQSRKAASIPQFGSSAMKTSRFFHRRSAQSGYILLAVLLALSLLLIAMTAEAPRIAQQIRRDREEELIHRGTQYARALRRFYRKFGRYPSSLEQLESSNNLRFLRRRYTDPITGKDDWRIIHFGEAKVVPKTLATTPGAGSSLPGAATPLPFGAAGTPTAIAGSLGTFAQQPAGGLAGGPGSASPGGSAPGTTGGTIGAPASSLGKPLGGGTTFGGGAIVGVASSSEQESLKELNGRNHYNDWEFVYDPRLELSALGGLPVGGANPAALGTPGGIQPPGPQLPSLPKPQ